MSDKNTMQEAGALALAGDLAGALNALAAALKFRSAKKPDVSMVVRDPRQDMQYGGRHSSSTYSDSLPDFKTLVEAFGHVGIKVERGEELEPALREAFSDKYRRRLVFVDVWVDRNEHVYPMAVRGGSMRDMILARSPVKIEDNY